MGNGDGYEKFEWILFIVIAKFIWNKKEARNMANHSEREIQ